MTKLIILRGPSGVGKTTVAAALMKRTGRPTVLVDLDHYRFSMVHAPAGDHDLEYELSKRDILASLERGFDVIFDGNFNAERKDRFLDILFEAHPDDNYLFYLDAALEETLQRHKTRSNVRIGTEKMKELYNSASPVGHQDEIIISQDSTLEQTVETIVRHTGIAKSR